MKKVVSIDTGAHRAAVLARRDALVEAHLELVHSIAARVHSSLPPSFDLDDLIGVGYRVLIELATRYRPEKHDGTPFEAYARPRLRGAMIDSVKRRRYLEQTRPTIEDAPEPYVAAVVEISIDRRRYARRIAAAIAELPAPMREIIKAHYGPDETTLVEISQGTRVGPERLSQLHNAAIAEIRKHPRVREILPRKAA